MGCATLKCATSNGCQIVVEKHGGSLDVQSELGQGTEGSIRLPIRVE
ncbi:MAG: hypothetical protein V7L29_24505 [Nostoc sp.]